MKKVISSGPGCYEPSLLTYVISTENLHADSCLQVPLLKS